MAKNPSSPLKYRQPDHQPQDDDNEQHYARLLLCVILILLFLTFHQNFDVLQFLGLVAAILSINLFEPVFKRIDRFDEYIVQIGKRARKFIGNHLASRIRAFLQKVKPYSHHLITTLLVIVILFLLFHTTISNAYSSTQDFLCMRTSLSIPSALCNSGLHVTTLPDGERIGLIGIDNASDAPFDTSTE